MSRTFLLSSIFSFVNSQLTIAFDLSTSSCEVAEEDQTILIIAIVVPIIGAVVIVTIILVAIPRTRYAIFPFAKRMQQRRAMRLAPS